MRETPYQRLESRTLPLILLKHLYLQSNYCVKGARWFPPPYGTILNCGVIFIPRISQQEKKLFTSQKKYIIYSIATYCNTNSKQQAVTSFKLFPPLTLIFLFINNNLSLGICCENIVDVAFLIPSYYHIITIIIYQICSKST